MMLLLAVFTGLVEGRAFGPSNVGWRVLAMPFGTTVAADFSLVDWFVVGVFQLLPLFPPRELTL